MSSAAASHVAEAVVLGAATARSPWDDPPGVRTGLEIPSDLGTQPWQLEVLSSARVRIRGDAVL
jgi:hypothetical protein